MNRQFQLRESTPDWSATAAQLIRDQSVHIRGRTDSDRIRPPSPNGFAVTRENERRTKKQLGPSCPTP